MHSLKTHSCTRVYTCYLKRSCHSAVVVRGLKENVAALPAADHVSSITVQPLGHTIPNAPGKKASVAIYNYLASKYNNRITVDAAKEGIQLYGEFVAEAQEQPGSHPNIDILLDVISSNKQLTIVVEQL